jgi:hypothetical protein
MSQGNISITYTPTSARPIRYENLRPGSYFRIVAEPSRQIRRSQDLRIYQRAYDGFYSEHPVTKEGCILHPQDLVMPMRKLRANERK